MKTDDFSKHLPDLLDHPAALPSAPASSGKVKAVMDLLDVVDSAVVQFNDSSGGDSPLSVCHFPGEVLFTGIEILTDQSGQQEKEGGSDGQMSPCSSGARMVGQHKKQCEKPVTTVATKQTRLLAGSSALPVEKPSAPIFGRSAAPKPVHKGLVDPFPIRAPRTPLITRSNAPSVSDCSETVRCQSLTHQAGLIYPGSFSPEMEQSRSADSDGEDGLRLPRLRGPSWSPLTEPPTSPVEPMDDIIGEGVVHRPSPSSEPVSTAGQQERPQTPPPKITGQKRVDSRSLRTPLPRMSNKPNHRTSPHRTRGKNGRMHNRQGRQRTAPTRWSPVVLWSPNRKASFHYDVQQRIAAATRGTHIDNGLLKVTVDYFDI
ncbi:hypothetical protein CH63R_09215 [Colletotrichum higginsianum IMI 349063]|uniref:Uncharacterized protein n=1 Tax=Colletotrichum higginsianum (strain IMI 349063) TaxID=759273 RepID=A0A1B7Y6R0_COLHI|nr:hypothetical protein CH63R_09215 [Colletotrichum higginsianum IMI 349063]OBR07694.1 hypothetical protein CH63R_09215 [Colletotrichum higginsianum IMI 349063]